MANPIATFDYALWVARYPEFSDVLEPVATMYFSEATIYHRNDGFGPVTDEGVQLTLLNMLTAHIAFINSGTNGNDPSPLVGPVTNASEGSVSVGVQPLQAPGTLGWLTQTKYGASYWYATAPYRTMRYRASPGRFFNPPVIWPYNPGC